MADPKTIVEAIKNLEAADFNHKQSLAIMSAIADVTKGYSTKEQLDALKKELRQWLKFLMFLFSGLGVFVAVVVAIVRITDQGLM